MSIWPKLTLFSQILHVLSYCLNDVRAYTCPGPEKLTLITWICWTSLIPPLDIRVAPPGLKRKHSYIKHVLQQSFLQYMLQYTKRSLMMLSHMTLEKSHLTIAKWLLNNIVMIITQIRQTLLHIILILSYYHVMEYTCPFVGLTVFSLLTTARTPCLGTFKSNLVHEVFKAIISSKHAANAMNILLMLLHDTGKVAFETSLNCDLHFFLIISQVYHVCNSLLNV